MMEVRCQDLGIAGCSNVTRGDTAGEVLEDIVVHLRQEHDLDMPPAKKLLKAYQEPAKAPAAEWDPVLEANFSMDEGARLVAQRLLERLERAN